MAIYRVALLLLLAACVTGEPPKEPDVPSQMLNLKAAGLWLTANPLDAPQGALSTADNVVLRRAGVVESRRGQAADATVPGNANVTAMAAFEGGVLVHTTDNQLARRVDSSTMSAYSGTYTAPTDNKVRFAEAGGGLYFSTNAGPYRLDSLTDTPVAAGVPPGLEGSGATTGSSGWLPTTYTTGYRLVWGRRDGDGTVLLGAPSGRILVTNAAGANRDVLLTVPLPDGIVSDVHFLQVYRTVREVVSPADPGEDFAQVAEVFPTAAEIAAGSMEVTDISSFANGPAAYFSQNTGGGVLDAKQQPPLLTDMVPFKGYMFGVVQEHKETFSLTLLAVSGADGLQEDDALTFFVEGGAGFVETFAASAIDPEGTEVFAGKWTFALSTGGTPAQNIEDTCRSLVRVINDRSSNLYATYAAPDNDLPGNILITRRDFNAGNGNVVVVAEFNAKPWTPALKMYLAGSLARVSNVVTVTTATAHHLAVGDTVELTNSSSPDFPSGVKTVATVPTTLTFTYAEVGADAVSAGESFETTNPFGSFLQEATAGAWSHSAFEEYDAWPPRFRYNVGGSNATLYRIVPQGEALLFFTSAGLYRLTGTDETDFTLRPLDETFRLVGAETPKSMGNKAYALTDQGVVAVSDLGVEKVSGPIDTALLPFYSGGESLLETTAAVAFGIAYESENEYILFLPSPFADEGDPPSQAYVYNAQTRTWVRWVFLWAAVTGSTGWVYTGIVPPDGRLYLANGDKISRERKNRALSDYVEPGGLGVPVDAAYQVQTAANPGVSKAWVEATFLLESPQPASVGVCFATEVSTTEEGGIVPTRGNLAVRTYIPRDKSRSARLTAGITHSTPSERLTLLGLSVIYNTASQRGGR
jgi:hypothetical protein